MPPGRGHAAPLRADEAVGSLALNIVVDDFREGAYPRAGVLLCSEQNLRSHDFTSLIE